jgi:hypothetical protein
MTISTLKIEANRLNAQKSTGPRSPDGKARVSTNSTTHGLRARHALMLTESEPELQELWTNYHTEWRPATHTEQDLVEQMVVAKWKLARYEGAETQACMQSAVVLLAFKEMATYKTEKGTIKLPDIICKQEAMAQRSISVIGQQIARVERSYFRALHTLQRLQDLRRRQLRNEPQPQPEPEPDPIPAPKVRTAGGTASTPISIEFAPPRPVSGS